MKAHFDSEWLDTDLMQVSMLYLHFYERYQAVQFEQGQTPVGPASVVASNSACESPLTVAGIAREDATDRRKWKRKTAG